MINAKEYKGINEPFRSGGDGTVVTMSNTEVVIGRSAYTGDVSLEGKFKVKGDPKILGNKGK